jgi:hypothetical protein
MVKADPTPTTGAWHTSADELARLTHELGSVELAERSLYLDIVERRRPHRYRNIAGTWHEHDLDASWRNAQFFNWVEGSAQRPPRRVNVTTNRLSSWVTDGCLGTERPDRERVIPGAKIFAIEFWRDGVADPAILAKSAIPNNRESNAPPWPRNEDLIHGEAQWRLDAADRLPLLKGLTNDIASWLASLGISLSPGTIKNYVSPIWKEHKEKHKAQS